MKKILAIAAFFAATGLSAAITPATVRSYAEKAFPRCADASFDVEPIAQIGPAGFEMFRVTQKSSDEYCGSQRYLLASPKTEQVILGTVIKLPDDPRPVNVRVGEHASNILKTPISARIAPIALPDGLKEVSMNRPGGFGQFGYLGFVDASEQFLMIGLRGNMKEDPRQTLRKALGISNGARRGNAAAKVEIVELSDFECPTCARAHKIVEPLIEKNLKKVNYVRLDLPLFEHHDWSFQAAMGARALQRVAPNKYWRYVNQVFADQDELKKETIDLYVRHFFEDNDLDWKAGEKIYSSASERQALLDQVSHAFSANIVSTPTYLINGQPMGFGPEGEFTVNAIRGAIGLPPVKLSGGTKKK